MDILCAIETKDINNGSVLMFNYNVYDEDGNKTGSKNGQYVRSKVELNSITDVCVYIWNKDTGKYDWGCRKIWDFVGVYKIFTNKKRDFHKFIKKRYPNCQFKYRYNEMLR